MGEPISPELVSVDPELAATARAALPEEPWQLFIPAPAPAPELEPAPLPVATEPVVAPRRSLRGAGIALAFVAAAVAGIVVGSTDVFKRANDRPSFAAEPPTAAPSVAATTGVTTTVAPPSVTATPTPTPAPAPTTPTRRPAPTTKSTAEGGFVPSRIFAWAPVAGADHYRVRFYRDGDVVLEGRPKQARFVLPPRFGFSPGTYRWTVEPRQGDTYGAPLVDSRFKVSG